MVENKMRAHIKLISGVLIVFFFIGIAVIFPACKKEEKPCLSVNESFIEINGERFDIDKEKQGVIMSCEFNSDLNGFVVAMDEFRHKIGGIIVDDFFAVLLKLNELKEGTYPLKRYEEYFCENKNWDILKSGEAISSIQINNCCSYLNEEAEIEVLNCNGSFLIKGNNINYREISCDVEQGGSFTLSFQLVCN